MAEHFALITGATSGLGLALAEALARRGRPLILLARHRDSLEALARELSRRFGVEVLFRACNLCEPLQVSGMLQGLEESGLRIELLVNNAGIGRSGDFIEQDWLEQRELLELNVFALTRLCHGIGELMSRQGGGQILNIASLAAFSPGPWMTTYYASKAYVLSFSEALREELRKHRIRVSVLCPGPISTAFLQGAGLNAEKHPLMMSAEDVAFLAVRALGRGPAVIIPGWRNRLLACLIRRLPGGLKRKLTGYWNRRLLITQD